MKIQGKITFVGAGNMGEAIIRGMLAAGLVEPEQLWVGERREARRVELRERYGINAIEDNSRAVSGAGVIVLAIKPQIFENVIDEIKPAVSEDALIISVAAGKAIDTMERRFGAQARVMRSMPNVAATVGQGATALAAGRNVTEAELELAKRIFDSVGMTVVLEEGQLDAVTGLSGSGPAYVFMVVEALADAGVKVGLSRWDAHALACQTVMGAAKLVIDSKEHPGRLKDMVCSPGGTAIAAVHTLEEGGLRTTLINAVEVAAKRSAELGSKGDD
ncbi:MAG: pyrroline-5-carboxylate reductase [Proteobacteria bacterium]|nr:MAG: pyrroline-5-carboxylate reductase [Pseudomonadota bacterium]PIE17174.1 MAG: pyrroline-5-carboxylate reductase [Pseudomonadota bacterium]